MSKTPETRMIGGSRIVLVRKYDGQPHQQPPMSPPKRCLLQREIRFVDSEPSPTPPLEELDEDDFLEDTLNHSTVAKTQNKRPYGLIGGGLAVSALVGLWFYTQNNSGE